MNLKLDVISFCLYLLQSWFKNDDEGIIVVIMTIQMARDGFSLVFQLVMCSSPSAQHCFEFLKQKCPGAVNRALLQHVKNHPTTPNEILCQTRVELLCRNFEQCFERVLKHSQTHQCLPSNAIFRSSQQTILTLFWLYQILRSSESFSGQLCQRGSVHLLNVPDLQHNSSVYLLVGISCWTLKSAFWFSNEISLAFSGGQLLTFN